MLFFVRLFAIWLNNMYVCYQHGLLPKCDGWSALPSQCRAWSTTAWFCSCIFYTALCIAWHGQQHGLQIFTIHKSWIKLTFYQQPHFTGLFTQTEFSDLNPKLKNGPLTSSGITFHQLLSSIAMVNLIYSSQSKSCFFLWQIQINFKPSFHKVTYLVWKVANLICRSRLW